MDSLAPVISVIEDNCVNCHKCISVCPVKFCIDGSGDTVDINHNLCIGCGRCIDACEHDARIWIDDSAAFFDALEKNRPVIGIVAPAVAASFPEIWPQLLGYLNQKGVEAFFDVSLGAELTVKSYLNHVNVNKPDTVIAQPCPAIVSYVEIYRPELLAHLAPADSPMLHTIKMVRDYWPQYADYEIAVLSPCLAKRREFDSTGTKAYNVSFLGLQQWLNENSVDLKQYPEFGFTGPAAERGAGFSTPGGLMLTAERDAPGISSITRKIEGKGIYEYLDSLSDSVQKGYAPLLVDCLNCEKGCNGGPGTDQQHSPEDLLVHRVHNRIVPAAGANKAASRKVWREWKPLWKPGLYGRSYTDRSATAELRHPSNSELEKIYTSMLKLKSEDHLHCAGCGYGDCSQMALAIFNGLNRPENCHHYRQKVIESEKQTVYKLYLDLHEKISGSEILIGKMSRILERVNHSLSDQSASLEESSASIEQMVASIANLSRIGDERREALDNLVSSAQTGESDLKLTVSAIAAIAQEIEGIETMVSLINDVADRTSLLSMNAAIQAAHAGDAGRGFAVVAGEIRKLAETTGGNVQSVGDRVSQIRVRAREGTTVSNRTGESIGGMIGDIRDMNDAMAELLNHTDEMSVGSSQITGALGHLSELSAEVQDASGEMTRTIDELKTNLEELLQLSEENKNQIDALTA